MSYRGDLKKRTNRTLIEEWGDLFAKTKIHHLKNIFKTNKYKITFL